MFGRKRCMNIGAVKRGHRSTTGGGMIFDPSGIRKSYFVRYPVVVLRLPPAIVSEIPPG